MPCFGFERQFWSVVRVHNFFGVDGPIIFGVFFLCYDWSCSWKCSYEGKKRGENNEMKFEEREKTQSTLKKKKTVFE